MGTRLRACDNGARMSRGSAIRQRIADARQRPTTRNMVQLIFGSGLGQVFTAISTLIATNALGYGDYGKYAACYGIATLTSTAFNFGMDGWLLQQSRGDNESFDRHFTDSLAARMLLGIPWFLGISLLAPLLNDASYPPLLMMVMAASVWADGLLATCHSFYKAKLQNQRTALLLLINTAGIFLLFCLCAWLKLPVEVYALARFAVTFVLLAIVLMGLFRQGHVRRHATNLRLVLSACIPFALSEFFYFIYMRSDVAIIGIQLNSDAVGQYAPASYLISALFLIPSSLYMVMVPVLSKRLEEWRCSLQEERATRQALLMKQLRTLWLVALVMGAALAVGAYWVGTPIIDRLLPATYTETPTIFRLLSPLLLFKTGSFAIGALLVAANLQTQRVRWQALVAVMSATVTYFVAKPYGITAVAWLYVATEALLFIGYSGVAAWWWSRTMRR